MKGKIEELLKLPYARVLTPDETGGYVAEVLELPGCVSEGDTAEQAVENLEDAMRGYLEVALEDGRHIPEPLESGEYNGRILVRVPKWVHRQCVRLAEVKQEVTTRLILGPPEGLNEGEQSAQLITPPAPGAGYEPLSIRRIAEEKESYSG